MDREKPETTPDLGGVVKRINELTESPPIEKITKVPLESKLLRRLRPEELKKSVDRINKLKGGSNSDENLKKVLWFERPTKEEAEDIPNPEEEAFFEILREKRQEKEPEEPINVVPRPPMVRKFRRLIEDADKEYVMSEGEKKILEGYAEGKRKAKEQRVGKYIEKLKKEKVEQDKRFPDIIGGMEKGKSMPDDIVNHSSQKEPSPVEHRESLRQEREKELNRGVVRTALGQVEMNQARTKTKERVVDTVEPAEKKESFGERMKRIEDAKSGL